MNKDFWSPALWPDSGDRYFFKNKLTKNIVREDTNNGIRFNSELVKNTNL